MCAADDTCCSGSYNNSTEHCWVDKCCYPKTGIDENKTSVVILGVPKILGKSAFNPFKHTEAFECHVIYFL